MPAVQVEKGGSMKLELQGAKVELEVGDNASSVIINGERIPVPREVGIRLVFGDMKSDASEKPTAKPFKRGCQTEASKKKLSASLKRFHANRRRKETIAAKKKAAAARTSNPIGVKKAQPSSKQVNGKQLNGKLNGFHLAP